MYKKRKQLILVIVILVLISMACLCNLSGLSTTPSIVGTWEGTYDGTALQFIFESNGNFVFNMDGALAGNGTYVVDNSITPIPLDLHYSDGMNVYSIIEFPDNNTMKMENSDGGDPRPTVFSDFATLLRVTP